jgi:hypothetical protein
MIINKEKTNAIMIDPVREQKAKNKIKNDGRTLLFPDAYLQTMFVNSGFCLCYQTNILIPLCI